MPTIACSPCQCKTRAFHDLLHPDHPLPAQLLEARPLSACTGGTPPPSVYDTAPELADPQCGLPRPYNGPPAGMDRSERLPHGVPAPRPSTAPSGLPFDPHRPYFNRADLLTLDQRFPTLSPVAKALYTTLATFYNWRTRACFPARATLHQRLSHLLGRPLSDYGFRQALHDLRAHGLISWDRGGTHHANRYRFHLLERLIAQGLLAWDALIARFRKRPPMRAVIPPPPDPEESPTNRDVRGKDSLYLTLRDRSPLPPTTLLLGETRQQRFAYHGRDAWKWLSSTFSWRPPWGPAYPIEVLAAMEAAR